MFMDGGTGPGCSRYSCHKPGAFAETGFNCTGEVTSYQQNWRTRALFWRGSHSVTTQHAHNKNNELSCLLFCCCFFFNLKKSKLQRRLIEHVLARGL